MTDTKGVVFQNAEKKKSGRQRKYETEEIAKAAHKKKKSEWRAREYNLRKEEKVCVECKEDVHGDYAYCEKCRAFYAERMREYRAKFKLNKAKCGRCGRRKSRKGYYCRACVKDLARMKKNRENKNKS